MSICICIYKCIYTNIYMYIYYIYIYIGIFWYIYIGIYIYIGMCIFRLCMIFTPYVTTRTNIQPNKPTFQNQKTRKPKNHDQLDQPGIPLGHICLGGGICYGFFVFLFFCFFSEFVYIGLFFLFFLCFGFLVSLGFGSHLRMLPSCQWPES